MEENEPVAATDSIGIINDPNLYEYPTPESLVPLIGAEPIALEGHGDDRPTWAMANSRDIATWIAAGVGIALVTELLIASGFAIWLAVQS